MHLLDVRHSCCDYFLHYPTTPSHVPSRLGRRQRRRSLDSTKTAPRPPPSQKIPLGTRRNKKPKSPRNPVYNVKRVHVPRTPFVRRRPPPRRRGVVVAASRDASDDEVRSALRRDDGVDGAERARAGARRERASARNDATTTARTTTAKRGDGRWRGRIFPARDRRGGGGRARVARVARSKERQECARRMRARTPRMGTVRARWWASSARRRRTEGGETRERLEGVD